MARPESVFGIVSPPNSVSSSRHQVEDDEVFHTPPEHHLPTFFSSEEQSLGELSSDDARTIDVKDQSDRVSERIRVPDEEFSGETPPALDSEVIVDEIEGEIIAALDHADTGEEMVASDSADRLLRCTEGCH